MKYTKYQNQLPREHRNTPWAENDPDFGMTRWEKIAWSVISGIFFGFVLFDPFGWLGPW